MGVGEAVGSGVGVTVAVEVGAGVGVGVGLVVGAAVGAWVGPAVGAATLTTGVGVGFCGDGVASGAVVGAGVVVRTTSATRGVHVLTTKREAANTSAPPSIVTTAIVATRVPVVRIAPRKIWTHRSDSQERRS